MNKLTVLTACLLIIFACKAQTDVDSSNNKNGSYIDIGVGLTTGSLRDMGTSPLFYTAFMPVVNLANANYFKDNLITCDLDSYNGVYLRTTENDYYSSSVNSINFELSYFRHYKYKEDEIFEHWPGVSISNYAALRINSNFGNAAFTLDNISSVNLNYMIQKRFTRKEKDKKLFWLIPYKRKQKNYLFSFKAGVPVHSLIYRPGYTNPGNSTQNGVLLPGYKFTNKVFSGMNTNLSLSRILKNGNMYRFSYQWDFFTSGRYSLNRLDYSKHSFLFTLVFKIK